MTTSAPGRQSRFHSELDLQDSELATWGCRHSDPKICGKQDKPGVCAFVRADGICIAPPSSWAKRYRALSAASKEKK